jgi:NitT/TauT family transport system substrate-binding protein
MARRIWNMICAIAAVAAAIAIASPASAEEGAKLRVGVLRLASSAPVFIAKDRGYFQQHDVEVELTFFDAAQPVAVAVAAGDIDIGVTAFTAGLFNIAGKGAITVVAGQSREQPGYPLIAYTATKAAYDAGLKWPQNLAGHTVGITQTGSSFHYSLGLLAEKYKFDLSSVRLLPLQSLGNVAAALKGGRIDAALLPITTATPLIEEGDIKLLGYVGDETPWQLGAVFVSRNILKNNRDAVARFLEGYREGTRIYRDKLLPGAHNGSALLDGDTRPFVNIIAHYTNLSPEQVLSGLSYIDRNGMLDVAGVGRQLEWFQKNHFVDSGFTIQQIVDTGFGFTD